MNDNLDRFERASDDFERILKAVPANAWERQSPCALWKAVDIAGHVIATLRVAEYLCLTGVNPPEPGSRRKQAGPDPVSSYVSARAATRAAVAGEGALERVVDAPIGHVPMGRALSLLVLELVAHAWDLGQAAGVPVALDAELVAWCNRFFRPMDEALRRPFLFEAKVEPPAGADEVESLMAFLGRHPLGAGTGSDD